jgi:hypothetical protein
MGMDAREDDRVGGTFYRVGEGGERTGDDDRSELKLSVSEMKWGKGTRRTNAASVEEGRRCGWLDFLMALEVHSVLSAMAAATGMAWRRRRLGMARGERRDGEWARWATSPGGLGALGRPGNTNELENNNSASREHEPN